MLQVSGHGIKKKKESISSEYWTIYFELNWNSQFDGRALEVLSVSFYIMLKIDDTISFLFRLDCRGRCILRLVSQTFSKQIFAMKSFWHVLPHAAWNVHVESTDPTASHTPTRSWYWSHKILPPILLWNPLCCHAKRTAWKKIPIALLHSPPKWNRRNIYTFATYILAIAV